MTEDCNEGALGWFQRTRAPLGVLLTILLAGCSRPEPRAGSVDEAASEVRRGEGNGREPSTAAGDDGGSSAAGADECLGRVVPPRGAGGEQYLQEPAVSASEDLQEVVERAREKLLSRLCQGYRCKALAREIQTWEIQEAGSYRCSKAVVAQSEYDEWLDETERHLERRLRETARKLVEATETEGAEVRVAIAPVEDHRAVGGPRAHWLHDKMEAALTEAGATLVEYESGEMGGGRKLDGTVSASVYTRETFEKLLEVTWRLAEGGEVLVADSVSFPEVVSPEVAPETYLPELPEGDGSVTIHFDYLAGGGFCNGQRFELWLETDERLHVRIVNLSGESGHVIYPRSEEPSAIEAEAPVSLGEFRAVRTDHPPVERWVVLAAPTREGLGKFSSLEAVCRLPSSVAEDLERGRGLTEPVRRRLGAQSYRIMQDSEACASYGVTERTVERTLRALEETSSCWSGRSSSESDGS